MISAVMLQKKVSLSLAKGVEAEVAVHGGGAGILPDGSRGILPRVPKFHDGPAWNWQQDAARTVRLEA